MIPTAEQLDEWFKAGALKRLGMGVRRACYAIPDMNLCVKCYRSDAEISEGKYPGVSPISPLAPAVVREIRKYRFDEKHNTSCQECRYWNELKRRLPSDLMDVFPSVMGQVVVPVRGWCAVEEIVSNADGSEVKKFHEALAASRPDECDRLFAAFDCLVRELCHHAVRFYDPQNVLVQRCANGSLRLRITDFEPASRTFIPLDSFFTVLTRLKIKRRFARYRKVFGIVRQFSGTGQNCGILCGH